MLYRDSILVTHYMATARVAISGKYCIDVFFHSPIQKLHAINTQTTFRIVFDCEDFLQFPSEKLCLKIYYSLCLLHKKHIALMSISCRILLGLGWSPLLPIFFSYTFIYLNIHTVHCTYIMYTQIIYIYHSCHIKVQKNWPRMLYKLYTTVYLKYLKNNFSISAVFRRKYIKYIFKYIKGRLAFKTYRH